MASASLVLGILSLVLVFGFFPLSFIGVILGILAVIFGAVAKAGPNPKKGMAIAGFIMGIIGISFGTIFTMIFITSLAILANFGQFQIANMEVLSQIVNGILDWVKSMMNNLQEMDNSLHGIVPAA